MTSPELGTLGDQLLAIQREHATTIGFIRASLGAIKQITQIQEGMPMPPAEDGTQRNLDLTLLHEYMTLPGGLDVARWLDRSEELITRELVTCHTRTAPYLGARIAVRGSTHLPLSVVRGMYAVSDTDAYDEELFRRVGGAFYVGTSTGEASASPTQVEGDLTLATPAMIGLRNAYVIHGSGGEKYEVHNEAYRHARVYGIFEPGPIDAERTLFPDWEDRSVDQPPLTAPLIPQITVNFLEMPTSFR